MLGDRRGKVSQRQNEMMILNPCPYQYTERPVTARRLAAARRALEKQRAQMPLFAFDITQTPEERIDEIDGYCRALTGYLRSLYARQLRDLRRVWRAIPADRQEQLAAEWARCNYPKQASYALEWLARRGWCRIEGELRPEGFQVIVHLGDGSALAPETIGRADLDRWAQSGKVKKQPPDLTAGEFNRREC